MKNVYLIISLVIIVIIGFIFFSGQSPQTKSNTDTIEDLSMKKIKTESKPTQSLQIDKSKKYSAILHTQKGDITISLTADKTPITVNNFISLARKGFYDNTIFHRIIKGFMIQGGDPKGDGTGGPGYHFADEPFEGAYTQGVIAMANAGPNTNGSQFFIMHADYALPANYVIFGKVNSGIETVDAIAQAPVQVSTSGEMSSPVSPVKVLSIVIEEK